MSVTFRKVLEQVRQQHSRVMSPFMLENIPHLKIHHDCWKAYPLKQRGSLPLWRYGSQNKPQGQRHWKLLHFLWNMGFLCSLGKGFLAFFFFLSSWHREKLACCHAWLAAVFSSIVLSQQWSVCLSRKHLSLHLHVKQDDHLLCLSVWGYHEVNRFMADYLPKLERNLVMPACKHSCIRVFSLLNFTWSYMWFPFMWQNLLVLSFSLHLFFVLFCFFLILV